MKTTNIKMRAEKPSKEKRRGRKSSLLKAAAFLTLGIFGSGNRGAIDAQPPVATVESLSTSQKPAIDTSTVLKDHLALPATTPTEERNRGIEPTIDRDVATNESIPIPAQENRAPIDRPPLNPLPGLLGETDSTPKNSPPPPEIIPITPNEPPILELPPEIPIPETVPEEPDSNNQAPAPPSDEEVDVHMPPIPPEVSPYSAELDKPIPPEVMALLEVNTVYIANMGCSGLLLPGLGIVTAEHCGFDPPDHTRPFDNFRTGPDGQSYYLSPTGYFKVLTGDLPQHDVFEGEKLTQLFGSAPGYMGTDVTVLALEGRNMVEVLDYYNANKLSNDELLALQIGTPIYTAGYPVHQPENNGPITRQEFTTVALGVNYAYTRQTGENVRVLYTGGVFSGESTTCSPGMSGNNAITADGRIVGPQYAYIQFRRSPDYDFTADESAIRDEWAKYLNADLTGMDFVCAYAIDVPELPGRGASTSQVSRIISSDDKILDQDIPDKPPDHTVDELMPDMDALSAFTKKALEDYNNPDLEKKILRGMKYITPQYNQDTGETSYTEITNPIYFYDSKLDMGIIGYFSVSGEFVITPPIDRYSMQLIPEDSTNDASVAYYTGTLNINDGGVHLTQDGIKLGTFREIDTPSQDSQAGYYMLIPFDIDGTNGDVYVVFIDAKQYIDHEQDVGQEVDDV